MERKLAAILAADIAGYSRLMGVDEESTLTALRAHREIVDRLVAAHHGRVFNTAGDSIIAEFSSAVEAAHCAVDIQTEIAKGNDAVPRDRRLEFRIGLNIGDVMAEDGNMFGDGINVADRVQKLAQPGGICSSRNIYEHVRNKADIAFEFLGQHHVKNIAEPVAVYRILTRNSRARPLAVRWLFAIRRRAVTTIAVTMVVLIATGGAMAWHFCPRLLPSSRPPTIAVLPFNNMSGDATLDYFSDGVTDSIIGMLARYPNLIVAARNSSFTYKGKAVDIRQVGRELNVRYVLEGSVQKSGDKLRIIAQLIETDTGEHVWADRFDEEGSDPLALQDQVTDQIVIALGGFQGQVQKAEYEQAWGKDAADLGEYDYYLRGHDFYFRYTKEDNAHAREIFLEGLQKFPQSNLIRVKLGWAYFQDWLNQWSSSPQESLHLAFEMAQEALAVPLPTPMLQWTGRWLMANTLLYYKHDPERALAEAKATRAIAPYDPDTLADLAVILVYAGEPAEAIDWLKEALRRTSKNWYHQNLSFAYNQMGEYQLAIEESTACGDCTPFYKHWNQLISYCRLGRLAEARLAAVEMRKLRPDFTVSLARAEEFYADQANTDRELDELRQMGFPEK